jgi:hypothetical protein
MTILASLAVAIAIVWGIAHLVPTQRVVAGFGGLRKDSRLVITQEWVAEGITLTFPGVLVGLITTMGQPSDSVLTAVTGARGSVVFFKICPIVKMPAAVLPVASILWAK